MSTHPSRLDQLMRDSALPRHEARRLMSLVTSQPMTWLIAHGDDEAGPDTQQRFEALAARRRAGEPLAYLTGEQEFYGRAFLVSPAVLIPRADTETLIDVALEKLAETGSRDAGSASHPAPVSGSAPAAPSAPVPVPASGSGSGSGSGSLRILDLGTGSGIIAITLALALAGRPGAKTQVHAVDRADAALAVARQNATRLGATVQWHQGSWWDALPADCPPFDLVVANPPYIAAGDHHLQQGDLRFEPPEALAAGPDGLDDLRLIIASAGQHLSPGGWLLLEHGYDQQAPVQALLQAAGLAGVFTRRDLAGQPRVSGGQWLHRGSAAPPGAAA
ncbi:MAG: HemK/PrmC family methyltransferase [Lautropia sp.]|nr:HemK/PrmC family methyltransferase [Lautropia sp.]